MAVKNKALTDEEIIKAFNIVVECEGKDAVFANVDIKKEASCEYKHIALTFGDILDLLNRRQAEVERLQTEQKTAETEALKEFAATLKETATYHLNDLDDDGDPTKWIDPVRVDKLLAKRLGES